MRHGFKVLVDFAPFGEVVFDAPDPRDPTHGTLDRVALGRLGPEFARLAAEGRAVYSNALGWAEPPYNLSDWLVVAAVTAAIIHDLGPRARVVGAPPTPDQLGVQSVPRDVTS